MTSRSRVIGTLAFFFLLFFPLPFFFFSSLPAPPFSLLRLHRFSRHVAGRGDQRPVLGPVTVEAQAVRGAPWLST